MFGWLRRRKRKRLTARPWPEEWSEHLDRNVRLSRGLSESERSRLCASIQILVAEKDWEGCDGLEMTDEIRVTISAHISFLLLGVESFYFERVRSILVYPESFRRETYDGLLVGKADHAGQAWQGGPILLSWLDVLWDGRSAGDGRNLVLHEFAHALDGLDGEMGGNITFSDKPTRKKWDEVVDREFEALRHRTEQGLPTVLDPYGASSRAEFFAVATEAFFERPLALIQWHLELFELLQTYYQVDPRRWQ